MGRSKVGGSKAAIFLGVAGTSLALASTVHAQTAPLPLSYSTTSPDGVAIVTTPTYGTGTTTVVPNAPTSYNYGNTYSGATPIIPGTTSSSYPAGFGFYDDYVFTVAAATVDSISSTLTLGSLQISGLQERLFNLSGNTLPTLGTPVGGAIDAWTTPVSGAVTGTINELLPTTLSAGTYVLELRGTVTGTGGGSYAGVLNVTPVPLPAALPLLLGGLGLLGGAARRRPRAA